MPRGPENEEGASEVLSRPKKGGSLRISEGPLPGGCSCLLLETQKSASKCRHAVEILDFVEILYFVGIHYTSWLLFYCGGFFSVLQLSHSGKLRIVSLEVIVQIEIAL